MVLESNTLDFLFLNDGKDGVGTPGENGKTLYTWVKYSEFADGADMTDDPNGAIYIGLSYNNESSIESTNPLDYNWSKIKGSDGEDAYTIILSNEAHTFTGNTTSAIDSSTKCEVTAFKGTTQMPVTIGTITGLPTGMTAPISNNGTMNTYFSPTVTTSMNTNNGTLTIPITIDKNTFTKYFSYSLALQGQSGESGVSVSKVEVLYCKSTSQTELVGEIVWSIDKPTWESGTYIWSKQRTTLSNGKYSESEPVCITGEKGESGDTGRGIESITTEYYLSTSKTEQLDGKWTETQPEWTTGHYVWTRSKIIYNNPTSVEYTSPVCDTTWEAIQAQIDTVTKTVSGVSSKVDAVEKSIKDEVWKDTFIDVVDENGNSVQKTIGSLLVTHETSLNGIESRVSDIQTTVSNKADGSTVTELQKTVTENKQDADSFKQSVKDTYATKDSLNGYATTSQVTSAIEQKANIILGTVTDSEGNSTTYQGTLAGLASQVKNTEDRMTMIEQTSEEVSIKAGNAEKLALESKVLSVNLTVETMTIATDKDGNNGNYSNCKTTISVSYGIEDVTAYATINCIPSDGMDYSIDFTSKTCSVSNMTVDTGTIEINATYTTTIDDVEQTLSATKTFSVTKSKQGVSGSDGKGVAAKEITYQVGDSGTIPPTGTWLSDIPTVGENEYLWTKTVDIYTDDTRSDPSYSVSKNGKNGQDGDGVSVVSQSVSYQRSNSGTDIPTGEWVETIIEDPKTETVIATLDESGVLSYSEDATIDDDGVLTISSYATTLSDDGTLTTTEEQKYLWTRTIVTYSDGTEVVSYSVSCDGDKGNDGTSVKSVTSEYSVSTSDTEVTSDTWTETPPIKQDGEYIWKRERTVYDDGTTSYSSPVLDASLNKLFEVTAELTVGQEEIVGKVNDVDGKYTELKQTSDSVTLFIGDENLDGSNTLEATMNGLETTVKKYTDDKETALEAKIQINADAISQRITSADAASLIKQESEKISSTVSDSINGLQSQIEQDAESVKLTFNKLGMYDENASDPYNPDNSEKSCSSTLVTVDYDGLSVEGNSESGERIKTVIKNGIYGYNSSDENIFYLDQDGCHTGRVYMDRGFEAIGMKMVPTVINGVNTLSYVKIGGNS